MSIYKGVDHRCPYLFFTLIEGKTPIFLPNLGLNGGLFIIQVYKRGVSP